MIGRPAGAGRWPRVAAVPAMLAAWAVGLGAPAPAAGKAPQQADAAPALPASEVAVPRPASAPAEPPVPAPSPDPAPAPADPEPAGSPAVRLAAGLLDTIPPGARLALRPLDPRESRLPQEDGARLYEEVLNAIVRAAAGRGVAVLARERLHEVYGTLEEFYQGDVESMLRAAQADVEVICKASPVADGVNLSCGAVDLVETVTVAHAMARFPLERTAAPYSHAVAEIARRLADGAPAVGPVERVMLMDVSIGARGDLGVYLGQRLEGEVVRQFVERARREGDEARVAAVLGTAPDTSGEVPRYRLAGDLWRLDDDRVRLEVRLRHRGRSLVAAGADIATSSLPPRLAARSGAGGSPGRMYEAVAEAVVSERLDRAAAVRAARNLARARVVAQALGRPPPGVTEVRSEADAVMSFEGFLDAGIPVDEGFDEAVPEGEDGGGQRVALRLAARVAPIGRVIRPAVSARLDRTVYRALEPIRVELRSEEAAHLGLFAWGADNRVVRLYPRERDRLVIGAGEPLVLPRRGEGRILSAPLPVPGNREDHEAFVVVASPSPINFAAMARAAGASLTDTMSQSVEGSRFLAALAGQDPARMAVIWLPYQVHD
ncbi:MAG: hypothetical protein OXC01_11435 [Immundisolibacterales bacterium]|nr:hypothetical protein [Immundisolibacterales bacterium]